MAGSGEQQMVKLIKDTTLRWSCRRGDYVLWLQFTDPIAEQSLGMVDLGEMRDGDFVTNTNRPDDLPASFELHPTEVRNALAYQMAAKLEKGYQPPDEPADGPNIWRLKSGDRMAWVGNSRPGQEAVDGILAILDCRECCLAFGETNRGGIEDFTAFGSPSKPEASPDDTVRCQTAVKAVRQLGIPRTWAPVWGLG
jgi:hypothetical protein